MIARVFCNCIAQESGSTTDSLAAERDVVADGSVRNNLRAPTAADLEFRRRCIQYVETLRVGGTSESTRWMLSENHSHGWARRGLALVAYVRPDENMDEFGAGRADLRIGLPSDCHSAGILIHPIRLDNTLLDLNVPAIMPIDGFDVALFSGVLEHFYDFHRLTDYLARQLRAIVASSAPFSDGGAAEVDTRAIWAG